MKDSFSPRLQEYDIILVNISGGKDSQAALDVTWRAAATAGVTDRLVTVFADLGEHDEWPGTRELAAEHAAHYGIRHEVVWRTVPGPDGPVQETLSEHILRRGMWPDAARRYCTSDMKRAPVYKLLTRLVRELQEQWQTPRGARPRRVRILNVLGMRAEESPKRAAMAEFRRDERATNATVRVVDEWLPVHAWNVGHVWERIAECGTRPHPVYAQGMPRLSCRFCPLASASALVRAAQLDPEGAQRRADMERQMDHSFKVDLGMPEIIRRAQASGPVVAEGWAA
jgi:3'-phosphoadenosine 5'-phosphosulfate sulfotransferase (PAPS reductase)/FAD synthetase